MKIFVESLYYDITLIKAYLDDSLLSLHTTKDGTKASIQNVGYIKGKENDVCVILPKVFINNDCLFRDIPYEEFLDESTDLSALFKKYGKTLRDLDFLANFSINLYRVLKKYSTNHHLREEAANHIQTSIKSKENTLLDVIFSLIKIHRSNKYLFIHTKNLSFQKRKILWGKTIKKVLPNLDSNEGSPMYFEVISQKTEYTQEDTLLVIFYSVLNEIKNNLGFNIVLDEGLPIIKGNAYKRLKLKALRILKKVRGKYFNDKFKTILHLLILYFNYFDQKTSSAKVGEPEYLLTNNFNLVFEDMIDQLISNPDDINYFKEQEDGKILDHIYHDKSIFLRNNTFYIGDSKYYKDSASIGSQSKYKQFTYARNLVNVYLNPSPEIKQYIEQENIILRDPVTEGYNIIPNFFIIGTLNHDDYTYISQKPIHFTKEIQHNHFPNRIFDRDTITVLYFELNFLYAVNAYLNKNSIIRSQKTEEIREYIKNIFLSYYQNRYYFYQIDNEKINDFIKKEFFNLNGKIIKDSSEGGNVIIALEKSKEDEIRSIMCLCKKYSIEPKLLAF